MRLYVSIIGVFALFSSAAAAQVVVLGESPAARCYDAAIAGRQDGVAINECRTALDRRQISRRDRAATYINMGILYLNAQRYDAAMRAFDDAEAMNLVPPGALAVNRSNAMIRTGRFTEAVEQTDIAIAAAEENLADAWFNRAVALRFIGEREAAVQALEQALEVRPGWAQAENQLEIYAAEDGS